MNENDILKKNENIFKFEQKSPILIKIDKFWKIQQVDAAAAFPCDFMGQYSAQSLVIMSLI